MNVRIELQGPAVSSDDLRSLRAWLVEEEDLRGRVREVQRAPDADSLGPTLEALQIIADPAAGVLTAALVTWLKNRTGTLKLVVRSESGASVELESSHARTVRAEEVGDLAERLSAMIEEEPEHADPDGPGRVAEVRSVRRGQAGANRE
ncbi:hypothetical protein GCM10010472_71560 [Pseudonocardia halophobica]|uniref:Uncharacterized protein n=1 Tax=Pseudonocardia halophobica TaxID=29401 RepID=A0A9W6L131_9PSEU|nr:hypothetical protein [Pseudonocardia halophobica]GLL10972.1 hypothetical protein GCM10017577_21130 [Pseudonocardia halophobica]